MGKAESLRKALYSKQPSFFLEAHNALSARIVEEAGFEGIWASGLAISSALGVRDNNEASWTQVLEVLEFMSDCTNIPILMDADTGYGNFNNVRRLVKKCEQRNIAGICIEDKIFPKSNSFRASASQKLVNVSEFCGKIQAAKDMQKNPSFCIVARTETLIVGAPLTEALERCEAYAQAGADAVLIHSKKESTEDIEKFMALWTGAVPVIIVPTTYASGINTHLLNQLGISLVLWANHMIRASIWHMQKVASTIYEQKSVNEVVTQLASINEIFRLQNAEELSAAEKKYLTNATILNYKTQVSQKS